MFQEIVRGLVYLTPGPPSTASDGAVPPDEVAGLEGGGEGPIRARPVSCSTTAAMT